MKQKQIFRCPNCGIDHEMEADVFIPGVYGIMYKDDGTKFVFVDPTTDHLCPACNDIYNERLLYTCHEM